MTLPWDLAPDDSLALAFARFVSRWALEQGASHEAEDAVHRAALVLSRATSAGHVSLPLGEVARSIAEEGGTSPSVGELRSLLRESHIVGSADRPAALPLILDDDDRLYLHRYFDYQRRLERLLDARAALDLSDPTALTGPVVALLDQLFPLPTAGPAQAPDWQRIAVVNALLGRLTIISGGPGTGKTTVIVNLIACLLEQNPACRIALTAPTGKAAARITETLRQRSGHLPAALRDRLPVESFTVHRLLGASPNGEYRHDSSNPLPVDVLIVDEASMLDLALAVHLFEALPPTARIIVLGDKDQLAAIEAGAIFSELSATPAFSERRLAFLAQYSGVPPEAIQPDDAPTAMPYRDCAVWLRRNYRFGERSPIGQLATAITAGDAAAVLARLRRSTEPGLAWVDDALEVPSTAALHAILDGYRHYFGVVDTPGADPRAIMAAFGRFRVLCAVRDGARGVDAINRLIGAHCRRESRHPANPGLRSEWYPGRPVMVLRNDYVLNLFNGDVGIALPDEHGQLQIYFSQDDGALRSIAPLRLSDHETAFAMTVHKSQGSEFDAVTVVLPTQAHRVLSRELLYTAVTRARTQVTIVGDASIIAHTVASSASRRGDI